MADPYLLDKNRADGQFYIFDGALCHPTPVGTRQQVDHFSMSGVPNTTVAAADMEKKGIQANAIYVEPETERLASLRYITFYQPMNVPEDELKRILGH
jgi:hypothetical protein